MEAKSQKDREKGFRALEALSEASTFDAAAELHIRYLLGHPYQWFRIQAAEILGRIRQRGTEDLLAMALNDRCEYVAEAAAKSLESIGTSRALEILKSAYLEDVVDRPHYLANALSQMGDAGFQVLVFALSSESPTLRYHAARGLGSSGRDEATTLLQSLLENDHAKTKFGGAVSTAARDALKTLARLRARDAQKGPAVDRKQRGG